MDTKTYDYMQERCAKFHKITLRINNLKVLVKQINESDGKILSVSISSRQTYLEGNDKGRIGLAISTAALEQIKMLEQILAEI